MQSTSGETVFWRYKTVGLNAAWVYSPESTNRIYTSLIEPLYIFNWEMVGWGDFGSSASNSNPDGNPDIFWREITVGYNAVWFMDSTGTNLIDTGFIQQLSDLDWEVGAVADFNNDAKADLLWRHRTDEGNNGIWYMNGLATQSTQFIEPLGGSQFALDWEIVGAGDFGSPTSSTPDGKMDILWRHRTTTIGQNALWYMDLPNNTNKIGSADLKPLFDLDTKIVGAGQFGAPSGTTDGKADILWRHATLGLN